MRIDLPINLIYHPSKAFPNTLLSATRDPLSMLGCGRWLRCTKLVLLSAHLLQRVWHLGAAIETPDVVEACGAPVRPRCVAMDTAKDIAINPLQHPFEPVHVCLSQRRLCQSLTQMHLEVAFRSG
jgi:hypothetical protein